MIKFDYIDHIAYAFNVIEDGYRFFESHAGFQVLKGPGINSTQGVRFLFVKVDGIGIIEILSPVSSSVQSPLHKQLTTSGPGFNHICYAVSDIEDSIKLLLDLEWRVVCNPVPDVAFSGRKISFLNHKKFGLIELLESKCIFDDPTGESDNLSIASNLKQSDSYPAPGGQTNSTSSAKASSKILELINKSIDTPVALDNIGSFEEIEEWDSLSYAIFHSLFESCVGKKLDMSDFNSLRSYIDFFDGLE